MRYVVVLVGVALALSGCSRTVTTVRTISADEYASLSWIGHSAEDVTVAWGANAGESDGAGGRLLIYNGPSATVVHVSPPSAAPSAPGALPSPDLLTALGDPLHTGEDAQSNAVAKFWIGANGKVYRYWFADEVYRKHYDSPKARPVEHYRPKTP